MSIVFLAILFVQACKDNNNNDSTQSNILEVAQSDSNFSTLVSSLEQTGLDATLEGSGSYTVFAPTNAAFDSLPDGLLAGLSNDQLTEILSYHVINSEIASSDLENQQAVETLIGDSLYITTDGGVSVNDTATVSDADIDASNGVIHAIDRVLLPDSYQNVFSIIAKRYTLQTLEEAIIEANLAGTLQTDTGDGYTIFAPNNDAFDNLPDDSLSGLSQEQLQRLYTYHVLSSTVLSTQLSDSQKVETASGDSLIIQLTDGTVTLTDNAGNSYQVITADVEGTNGVVHIINGVLNPQEQ